MWKILNYLFGWDYISWSNSMFSGVERIMLDGNGDAFFFQYNSTNLPVRITKAEDHLWLTCKPSKYLKN